MLTDLLNKLEKVKQTGHGKWIARCPSHADRTPSLAIRDNDGTILLHCFAGCSVNDICDSIGHDINQLFPPSDIDYKNYPQRKQQIPADQALEALQAESTIIYVIATKMLEGKIDQEDKERLLLACERIHAINVGYR